MQNRVDRLKVLDLFSGLGGFSEAFVKRGYEVLRIDNNPLLSEVPHTQIIDIFEFRKKKKNHIDSGFELQRPDIILASPPCYEFSMGHAAPRAIASREGTLDEYEPNMEFLYVAIEIIEMLNPKWWIIENVVGSIRYFEPILGKHQQKIAAFVFWGRFPRIHLLEQIPTKAQNDKRHSPLRSNHRAKLPLPLSMGILTAILEQTYLTDWY